MRAFRCLKAASYFIILSIGLSLPLIIYYHIKNIETFIQTYTLQKPVTLYLSTDLKINHHQLLQQLKKNKWITKIHYISPSEGLRELAMIHPLTEAIYKPEYNPLPPVITFQLKQIDSFNQLDYLLKQLKKNHTINNFIFDKNQLNKGILLMKYVRKFGGFLSVALISIALLLWISLPLFTDALLLKKAGLTIKNLNYEKKNPNKYLIRFLLKRSILVSFICLITYLFTKMTCHFFKKMAAAYQLPTDIIWHHITFYDSVFIHLIVITTSLLSHKILKFYGK